MVLGSTQPLTEMSTRNLPEVNGTFLLHNRIHVEGWKPCANRRKCAPWKIANDVENLVLQALQFLELGVCRKFPGGEDKSHY
jgi:hypothetical protein